MASEKKITMREYNGTDYDTLYPKTIAEQVDGIYSKDEVLSNGTKALYGLTDSAVPDDVLALLSRFQSGLGNEYVWEKVIQTIEPGYTEYQYGSNTILIQFSSSVGSTQSATIHYGDSYVLNADGKTISIPNETTFSASYSSDASVFNVLKGKWWWSTRDGAGNVYYLPSNAKITKEISGGYYNFKTTVGQTWRYDFHRVTKYTSYGYVNSPDSNAYPPAVSDGYTYLPLGQLGAKAQIESDSYVGTGTYGKNNPVTLNFNIPVKLLFISSANISQDNTAPAIGFYILDIEGTRNLIKKQLEVAGSYQYFYIAGVNLNSNVYVYSLTDHTVSLYELGSTSLNGQDITYNYIAIG